MKRNILFFVLIIVCLCACNDTENLEKQNNSQELNRTSQMFKAFNDSLLSMPHHVSTRGWSFTKILAVAGADFTGALAGVYGTKEIAIGAGLASGGTGAAVVMLIGGTLCSASASILASETVNSQQIIGNEVCASTVANAYQEIKEANIDYVKLEFPERFDYINIIGGMHNTILDYTNNNSTTAQPMTRNAIPTTPPSDDPNPTPEGPTTPTIPISLCQGTLQNQITSINSAEYQNQEKQILESNDFSQTCNNIIKATKASCVEGTYNSEIFFQKMNIQSTNNEKLIFDYYNELFNSYPNNINDVIYIANEYIKRIETLDELTDSERENLYLTISISVNSAYYWSK